MNKLMLLGALSFAALLVACGQETAPPVATQAPAPAPAPTAAAAPPAAVEPGERIYKSTCALCHAAGTAGAPIPGDKADWEPRLAQGMETIYRHALEGFTGEKGVMPPRGTGMSLSDDDIKAAVDYMVERSR